MFSLVSTSSTISFVLSDSLHGEQELRADTMVKVKTLFYFQHILILTVNESLQDLFMIDSKMIEQ